MSISVVLADDHAIVRHVLRTILAGEPDFEFVAEATDALEAVQAVKDLEPDVAVLDLVMPGLPGLEAIRQVRDLGLNTRVVVLSMHSDDTYVIQALRNGALGYVAKDAGASELLEAIRQAAVGRRYISPPLSPESMSALDKPGEVLEREPLQTRKTEAVGQLAGGIAHDFNNILTAIIGYCQLEMRDRGLSDSTRASLVGIQSAADRGAALCRQLLGFIRGHKVDPRVVSLNEVVSNMGVLLRRLIGEDIELVTSLQHGLGLVEVDADQFELVVVNLALNARDAMLKGGTLTIRTSNVSVSDGTAGRYGGATRGEYVRLTVSDTGVGMAPEISARVFEPFFTTKEPGAGTGLGLFTCYSTVSQNNGHIDVRSEPGSGTTFEISFPRVFATGESARPKDEQTAPRGSERVLLVEDEQVVREVAATALRHQGYRVYEAAAGAEALEWVEAQNGEDVDLLISDVVMPEMSGRELADRLRESRPGIRVLYISGYAEADTGLPGLDKERAPFIQKPFTPAELAQKVRAVLEE